MYKDHCRQSDETIDSEFLRGRSRPRSGDIATLQLSAPSPPTPPRLFLPDPPLHRQVNICYFPLGLFSLSSFTLRQNGLCKTVSGTRNRCRKIQSCSCTSATECSSWNTQIRVGTVKRYMVRLSKELRMTLRTRVSKYGFSSVGNT